MIRQFDVFLNPSRRGLEERPYVVVVQCGIWDDVATRICVSLIDERFIRPQRRLNPGFEVNGKRLYFHPIEIVSVPLRLLREPVANLEQYRYHIIAALDLVFTGI